MDISIRIAGEAGQGVQSAGNLLVGALARTGFHVFTTKSYMSRIRGGLNWFDIRISDRELFAGREDPDLLVALTSEGLEILAPLMADGVVLFDGKEAKGAYAIPFTEAAKEAGNAIMANSVAAGAVFAVLGLDNIQLLNHLRIQFKSKSDELIEQNLRAARRGGELAASCAGRLEARPIDLGRDKVWAGSDAIGFGAVTAGVKFVTAYPMTPSTATLNYLAEVADDHGILVEQAEDEIAAVNMVCGSAYAGAPSMTVTSGGGFALMVEGVSLAGMLELPVVILLAQRPGPATGLPTRTAQADLQFAIYAGHGEFPKAVLAPGSHEECFSLARHAFALALEYQTPVIILTDQFLQDAEKNIEPPRADARPVDFHVVSVGGDYHRYSITDSGVSPRAVPGGEAFVVVDSDEHDSIGHISEDLLGDHIEQHNKRMRKGEGLTSRMLPPVELGHPDADNVMVCWGSSLGPCREAIDALIQAGEAWRLVHFAQVWPINGDLCRRHLRNPPRIVVVEGNSTGQFASILRQAGVIDKCEHCLRYDGLPFTAGYIVEQITGLSSRSTK